MKKALVVAFLISSNVGLFSQGQQNSLLVTRIYGITASWGGECGPGVLDNRSQISRYNDWMSINGFGSGTWTAEIKYSDTSCTGPFSSFIPAATIDNTSVPAIAAAFGYHPYIQIHVTGGAVVTYSGERDFFIPIGTGGGGSGWTPPSGYPTQYLQITPNVLPQPSYRFSFLPMLNMKDYDFPAQSVGKLFPGDNLIALAPVPLGVNWNDTDHYLYFTDQACLIKSAGPGTATSGSPSGTLTVTCLGSTTDAYATSSTAGLAEAWNVGPNVYAPSGTYDFNSGVTPPTNGNLECFGDSTITGGGVSQGAAVFYYYPTTGDMFHVINNTFYIHGCVLRQAGNAVSSNGIKTYGTLSTAPVHGADVGQVDNVTAYGFYHGFSTDGGTGLYEWHADWSISSVGDGFDWGVQQAHLVGCVSEYSLTGNGITFHLSSSGIEEPVPWLEGWQSFGNYGWGAYASTASFHFGGMVSYFGNDRLGEVYYNYHYSSLCDNCTFAEGGKPAGNAVWTTNTTAPGVFVDSNGAGLTINNGLFGGMEGTCFKSSGVYNNLSTVTMLGGQDGCGLGGVAGNIYNLDSGIGGGFAGNLDVVHDSQFAGPIRIAGSGADFHDNVISYNSPSVPLVEVASGQQITFHNNYLFNATGVAFQCDSASPGVTLSDATNIIGSGSVVNNGCNGQASTQLVPKTLAKYLTAALPTPSLNAFTEALAIDGTPGSAPVTGGGTGCIAFSNGSMWRCPGSSTSGTVSSVNASATGIFGFTGGPVTGSGTLVLGQTGTSGGIPYFSDSSTLSSSTALGAGQFVMGGGPGTSPSTSFSLVPVANAGLGADIHATAGIVRTGSPFTASELSKDVLTSGSNSATVVGINSTLMSGLGTGILKNTTGTGVPSIAVAGDFPTLNQSTSGNAATATLAATATTALTATTATNLASYPALCTGAQFSQGLSSGSNNCATPSGGGGGTGFDAITSGTNSTATMAITTGATLSIGGNSIFTINGYPDTSAKLKFTADFSTSTTSGVGGEVINFYWPSAATRGSNEFYGITANVADPMNDGSNVFSCFNTGAGNCFYAGVFGQGSTTGSISSVTTGSTSYINTSGAVPFHGPASYVILAGVTGAGCTVLNGAGKAIWSGASQFIMQDDSGVNIVTSGSCGVGSATWIYEPSPRGLEMDINGDFTHGQKNGYFVGWGLAINDFTTSLSAEPNGEIPIFVQRHSIGSVSNPTMKFRNDEGPLYFDMVAGVSANQNEQMRFLNKSGTIIAQFGKNTSDQIELYDTQNTRSILKMSPGASSLLEAPQSILLASLSANALLCTDASKIITTVGCTGGGGGGGTVTRVDATVPAEMSVTGVPVTTTGTIAISWNSGNGSKFIATPAGGGSGAYAGRSIAATDLPTIAYSSLSGAPAQPFAIGIGGTGQNTTAAAFAALSPLSVRGDLIYENSTPSPARLAGPVSSTKQFLTSTGTGSAPQDPAWGTIASADLPGTIASDTSGNASTASISDHVPSVCSAGYYINGVNANWSPASCTAAPSSTPSFSAISNGTNTNSLLMGTGGSLATSGSGTIVATSLSAPYAGMISATAKTTSGGCGLYMDGSHDDYALLYACLAANAYIRFPPGDVRLSQQLTITQPNVHLIGAGGYAYRPWDSGGYWPVGTRFLYTGAQTINSVIKIDGTGATPHFIQNVELNGFIIDGNNAAGHGLTVMNALAPTIVNGTITQWINAGASGETYPAAAGYGVVVGHDAYANCGQSGAGSWDNLYIGTGFTSGPFTAAQAVGGMLIGSNDIGVGDGSCTNQIGRVWIDPGQTPGYHGLYIRNGDSNSAQAVLIQGNHSWTRQPISSIVVNSSGLAKVYLTNANTMPSGTTNDGVYIFMPCSVATGGSLSAPTCGGTVIEALAGNHGGTYVSSSEIDLTDTISIAAGTYYAGYISGTSLMFSHTWNDVFSSALTSFGVWADANNPYSAIPSATLSNWNWMEISNSGDKNYSNIPTTNIVAHASDGGLHGYQVSMYATASAVGGSQVNAFKAYANYAGGATIGLTNLPTPGSVNSLPTCPGREASEAAVIDSNTNTWGATVAAGGSYHVKVYCDGTNWTVEAK